MIGSVASSFFLSRELNMGTMSVHVLAACLDIEHNASIVLSVDY